MSELLTLEVNTFVHGLGSGRSAPPVLVALRQCATTPRALVADHVRAELARAQHARETSLALHYMLADDLRAAPQSTMVEPAAEVEITRAQAALAERRFMLVVDGVAVRDLDELLALTARSRVSFVRLLPLIGG